jgi:hypothetical protein
VEVTRTSSESVGYVLPDGTRIWLIDKRLYHRVDGPAVVHPDGSQEWWHLGWLHRDDGPAIVGPGGRLEWWHHGKPTWSDGERISPGLIRHDDYGCLGTGSPTSHIPRQQAVDLREIRLIERPELVAERRDVDLTDVTRQTGDRRGSRRA